MTITARVISDSCWEDGSNRLTTFVLRYPRFIHSEFMTHRVFSRNAASSRAIPVAKMIQAIKEDPAMPVFWGKNKAGMQAAEELSDEPTGPLSEDLCESWREMELNLSPRDMCKARWFEARDNAIRTAEYLLQYGLHKQIANRILEPWMHIEVVVTATDWDNFFALRNHPMAQPEFQELAKKMLEALRASVPRPLKPGQWHLPFITEQDYETHFPTLTPGEQPVSYDWLLPKLSSARCARVSYLKHDGSPATPEEDFALFDRLMKGTPRHASPTEHQARVPVLKGEFDSPPNPDSDYTWNGPFDVCFKYPSNLRGWTQFRKLIENE